MQPFSEVIMSVLGALILLCIAFGFLGSLFLLGSFSMLVFEYLLYVGKRVYQQGHEVIEKLHEEINEQRSVQGND
jgi:hypothetical protein